MYAVIGEHALARRVIRLGNIWTLCSRLFSKGVFNSCRTLNISGVPYQIGLVYLKNRQVL